jgi:hypothetical protein
MYGKNLVLDSALNVVFDIKASAWIKVSPWPVSMLIARSRWESFHRQQA